MRAKRAKYGVNSGWWLLRDILRGRMVHGDYEHGPVDFNPDSATLRGRRIRNNSEIQYGRLRGFDLRNSVPIDYVIYSYDTPIAWRYRVTPNRIDPPGGLWEMNRTKYSVTTSKHQGKVFTAIDQLYPMPELSSV